MSTTPAKQPVNPLYKTIEVKLDKDTWLVFQKEKLPHELILTQLDVINREVILNEESIITLTQFLAAYTQEHGLVRFSSVFINGD